ncbi:OLD family endonuclease [Parablautia intestinalis]|uniref:OLD family endonuclease n=2 Tax=Parablautia intestinalis TaxID=2320100 RepID=A0A3A9A6Q2_9FIRM|nr:OLD family endonuclease [Parablautia intestinalis]
MQKTTPLKSGVALFCGVWFDAYKSNLLLALWKLNPARGGEIDMLHDMPVSELSELREKPGEVPFVIATFEVEGEASSISEQTGYKIDEGFVFSVTRYYSGKRLYEYISGQPDLIETTDSSGEESDEKPDLIELPVCLAKELPKFVYYSNYGNLSSKIYLPYAVKWLNGESVVGITIREDQVRTLRVLFDFVNLDPKEILELGADPKPKQNARPNEGITEADIKKSQDNKEKRSILLQSASAKLTRQFKEWWKQGEYAFRLEADGEYFSILVSDNLRADEVDLELRSTGLQWFLSFYLIFLVESQEENKNAIILLDEEGLTLHPMAQKDLANFFNELAKNNQIINTTHSPFIVDTTSIDRCRVVYSNGNGKTVASSNLRENAGPLNTKSIYAVHAALGLSVSDMLLQGSKNVVIEGVSDQFYLNGIKIFLIREGLIKPETDIMFIPSGGVKGVSGVISIVGGKNNEIPVTIVDSDNIGKNAAKNLRAGIYKDSPKSVIEIENITKKEGAEIEDLIPFNIFEKAIDKMFSQVEDEVFADGYNEEKPIVPQIEEFASRNGIILETGAWKVNLAKYAKNRLIKIGKDSIDKKYIDMWKALFKLF